jgi:hypothetical protein
VAKEEKQHTVYRNSKGIVVPSCTTVLQVLNTPSLIYWANKIGKQGKLYSSEMASASRIGTLTHLRIEYYFKESQEVYQEYMKLFYEATDYEKAQALKAYANFLRWSDDNNFELQGSELRLVSDQFNYGGTIDYYGMINNTLMIMDFKTSNYFNKKMFLQLAGYRQLLIEHGYDVDAVMILKLSKMEDKFEIMRKEADELGDYFRLFKFCIATHKVNERIDKEWEWKKSK